MGGTRRGVKCLHAHLAYLLAGGDDPVGRWTLVHLDTKLDTKLDTISDTRSDTASGFAVDTDQDEP